MDMKALMSAMLSSDSLQGMSTLTGTSKKGVESVLASALPSLLNGAMGQAQNEETADSFAGALEDHAKDDTSSLGTFLSNVDIADGGKILGHLLGSKTDSTAEDAAGKSGLSTDKTKLILSAASPLLMSLLGQQTQAQKKTDSDAASPIGSIMGSLLANADMGSILSSVLGAGSADEPSSSSKSSSSSSKKSSSSSKKRSSSSKKKTSASEENKSSGGILDAIMSLLK